jgi:magnesium transporter
LTGPAATLPAPVAELSPELLQLLAGDPDDLNTVCAAYQPADVAVALRRLPAATAAAVIGHLPFEYAVQVLDKPELEHRRYEVIRGLDLARAGPLIEAMSSDQQAGLFRELPADDRDRFLAVLAPATRENLKLLLRYPPDSAGGIMTTELASVSPTVTAGAALAYVRGVAETKETIYAVYLVDPKTGRLENVVSLRELLIADPERPVSEAVRAVTVLTVEPTTDREEVARLIGRYNLLAVPVVDRSRRLLGIVTVDDVIDALVKEQTEDVQKLGGVEAFDVPYPEVGFGRMLRKRAGWLCALFLGETLTATAMGHFEEEIAQAVVLSLFVPLIISSGGNSGGQATTLIIRALALRELKVADWWRVALRELPSGLALGAILGTIGVARILAWQFLGWYDYGPHYALIALTVGVALIGVVGFGSLAGSMLPFVLRRLGFDPASASAPFVATLVDVTGLVIYFTVALVLLRGTLL